MAADKDEQGILAIWHGCAAGREAEFETWYQREHLVERLSVAGFLLGRRYEAVSAKPQFFTSYVTETTGTLTSGQYLDRLNNPTPLTTVIMSEVFEEMSRTACRRALRVGRFRGSTIVTSRFQRMPDSSQIASLMDELGKDVGVACGELWLRAEPDGLAIAQEERLRGGDRKIDGCLVVETLRLSVAESVASELSGRFPDAETGTYRLLCEIAPREA